MHIFLKLKRTFLSITLVSIGSLAAQTSIDSTVETISLQQALQRAIKAEPRLELNVTLAEAAEGQIEQANVRPNPVVGAEFENFLGTGPFNGVQALEATFGISQVIETADKRDKRTALARAERTVVDWQRESLLAEVEASVCAAFIDVLLAQEVVNLRRDQLTLSENSAEETAKLVETARSSQVEQTRAQLAVRQQQFALQQSERELSSAKSILASFWGASDATRFSVSGEVVLDSKVPDFTTLASKLTTTAALARYSAKERTREAALDLEHARAIPDFQVFAAGRYFSEQDENIGFVAGVNIPWPLFDKNQGNVRTARAQLRAVAHEREAVRRDLLIRLNKAYQQLVSAQADANLIESDLLPAAKATLRETEDGYERGKFTQLAVLESRATLFDVREAYLEALGRYGVAQAEIEALSRPANL